MYGILILGKGPCGPKSFSYALALIGTYTGHYNTVHNQACNNNYDSHPYLTLLYACVWDILQYNIVSS